MVGSGEQVGKFSSNSYKDIDLTPSCPHCSRGDVLTPVGADPPFQTSSSEPSLEQQD